MKERSQVVERKRFWDNQKRKMLAKSDGACAHCGVGLTEKTMTVEHVIPLSKGGTNDLSNTVALCKKCNVKKRNILTRPSDYYHHLKKEYLEELDNQLMAYLEKYDWLSMKSFFKLDSYKVVDINGKKPVKRTFVQVQKADLPRLYRFCDTLSKRVFGQEASVYSEESVKNFVDKYAVYGIKNNDSYSAVVVIRPIEVRYGKLGLGIELLPAYKSSNIMLLEVLEGLVESLLERGSFYISVTTTKDVLPVKGFINYHDTVALVKEYSGVPLVAMWGYLHGKKRNDIIRDKFQLLFETEKPQLKRSWFTNRLLKLIRALNPLRFEVDTEYDFFKLIKFGEHALNEADLFRLLIMDFIQSAIAWAVLTTIVGFFVRVPMSVLVIICLVLMLLCIVRANRFVKSTNLYTKDNP